MPFAVARTRTGAHADGPGVSFVRLPHDEGVPLEAAEQPAHRRRRDLFGAGEGADSRRPAENENGQGREPRR